MFVYIISYQAITGNNNIRNLQPVRNFIISYQAITGNNNGLGEHFALPYYIIPSDNWEQQQAARYAASSVYYIIPSDNWEQQRKKFIISGVKNYIIPSDNWEQQHHKEYNRLAFIISYQAITGNNNPIRIVNILHSIISYQAITGNNNMFAHQSYRF